MIRDDLKPTIEELLSFAHRRVCEEESREIEQVKVKIEEALFWLSFHDQKQLKKKIEELAMQGKEECPVIKLRKGPLKPPSSIT